MRHRREDEVNLARLGLRESKEQDAGVREGGEGDGHDEHDEEDRAAANAGLALVLLDFNPALLHVVLVLPRKVQGALACCLSGFLISGFLHFLTGAWLMVWVGGCSIKRFNQKTTRKNMKKTKEKKFTEKLDLVILLASFPQPPRLLLLLVFFVFLLILHLLLVLFAFKVQVLPVKQSLQFP